MRRRSRQRIPIPVRRRHVRLRVLGEDLVHVQLLRAGMPRLLPAVRTLTRGARASSSF
jgi:hypothetical protein